MTFRKPSQLQKHLQINILILFMALLTGQHLYGHDIKEARSVIERFSGKKIPMTLSLSFGKDNGFDRYEYSAETGVSPCAEAAEWPCAEPSTTT